MSLLTTVNGRGTLAARPAAAAANEGYIYSASDASLYRSNGTSWDTIASTGLADQGTATYLDYTTAAAPANPAAGKIRVYSKTGDTFAQRTSAGVETVFGAGGGSGALVLLEQYTASASATLNFTTAISATYDEYVFEIVNLMPATTNTNLYMRMGTGVGPTWDAGANYGFASWRWTFSANAVAGAASGLTYIGLDGSGGVKSDAVLPFSGSFRLFHPQSAAANKRVVGESGYTDNAGSHLGCTLSGLYLSITAVTGIQFLFSAGNITSGTIRAYGIAK